MPPPAQSPFQLRVEGSDDEHSIRHLLARRGFNWDDASRVRPYLKGAGGSAALLELIPTILKGSYERVGFVIDGNADPSARWQQIRDRAHRAGLEVPAKLDPDGTVLASVRPGSRVGFWLMPDNSSPGALEDFLISLVPAGDACWVYADEAATEARRRGGRCPAKYHDKSRLHTWLAWQEEPGNPFGIALKSEVLRSEGALADRFVTWFHQLFVDS